jgi:Uma2 family endonuclease
MIPRGLRRGTRARAGRREYIRVSSTDPSILLHETGEPQEVFPVETSRQQLTRWRFTVHDYHRMGEAGILHEDDRVELIEGELVEMTAIGTRHFSCVNQLNRLLVMHVGDEAIVSVQNPVRLNEYTEPQSDLAVIRPRDYRESLPKPEDVLLLIEVSDTTLAYDRGVKLPLYARAGIREVWIVDLPGETIERHTDPSEEGYRRADRLRRGHTLESISLPGLTPSVDELLG